MLFHTPLYPEAYTIWGFNRLTANGPSTPLVMEADQRSLITVGVTVEVGVGVFVGAMVKVGVSVRKAVGVEVGVGVNVGVNVGV